MSKHACHSNEGKFDISADEKKTENKNTNKKIPNLSLKTLIPEIFPHSPLSVSGRTAKLSDAKKPQLDLEEVTGSR